MVLEQASLIPVAGRLPRFPLHTQGLMVSPPPSEGSADQWQRPSQGCGRKPGRASPLTCIYLGAGLQEQTKVNTKPRCPSKRTKVKLGFPLTRLSQQLNRLLYLDSLTMESYSHQIQPLCEHTVHKNGQKSE